MHEDYYLNNTSKTHLLVSLQKEISKGKKVKLLDIGCGNCNYWKEFLIKNPNVEFYGIDINENSLKIARKEIPKFKDNIIFLNARSMSKLKEIKFDYITSNSALEHIYKIEGFFDMLSTISSSNTKLHINWDFGHFRSGKISLNTINFLSVLFAKIGYETHYTKEFSIKDFKKIIVKKGFEIIDEKYFNIEKIKEISKLNPTINKDWYEFELKLNDVKDKNLLNKYLDSAYFILKKK